MAAMIKVGINGFGRIGRTLFRTLYNHPQIKVVAINDIAPIETMAHLLKYDSIHGVLHEDVSTTKNSLLVGNQSFYYNSEREISNIDWKDASLVIECTGKFKTKNDLKKHLTSSVKKVILSVPPLEDEIKTISRSISLSFTR